MSEKQGKSKKGLGAGLVGLVWGPQGEGHDQDVAPEAPPRDPLPPGTTATPEALAKLRHDIGLDDPASLLRSFGVILEKLESAIPDEKKRYETALNVAGTQAITADGILEEFKDRIQRLHAAANQSKQASDALTAQKVFTKKDALEETEKAVAAKREELAGLERKVAQITADIQAEEAAILAMERNFDAAHDTLMDELQKGEANFRTLLDIKK